MRNYYLQKSQAGLIGSKKKCRSLLEAIELSIDKGFELFETVDIT